jgi:hypothetical protein
MGGCLNNEFLYLFDVCVCACARPCICHLSFVTQALLSHRSAPIQLHLLSPLIQQFIMFECVLLCGLVSPSSSVYSPLFPSVFTSQVNLFHSYLLFSLFPFSPLAFHSIKIVSKATAPICIYSRYSLHTSR